MQPTTSRNKREGWYAGKHQWRTRGDTLHIRADGKQRDHRGRYPTTVNQRRAAYNEVRLQMFGTVVAQFNQPVRSINNIHVIDKETNL